jgi:mono/diheme cytochrome c family protein
MSKKAMYVCRLMLPVGMAVLFAPNIPARNKAPAEPSGHDIYMERCAVCHGEDGKGNGPAVGSLITPPADLTLLSQGNGGVFPTEQVKKIVGQQVDIAAHGVREMPIWGDLFHAKSAPKQKIANDRFSSLIFYLESIQR